MSSFIHMHCELACYVCLQPDPGQISDISALQLSVALVSRMLSNAM